MSGTNQKIVQAFYDAVGRGDLPGATTVFADELTWVEPPFPGHDGGTFHGKKNAIENVLTPFMSTWSNLTVTPDQIAEAGDEVFVHGLYRGLHAKTKRPFESRFVHSWTITAGKAVRFEMLADTVQFFRTVRPNAPGSVSVKNKTIRISGVDIFYREAGPADAPVLILLHGFPSSSHMFRDLIPALQDRFHIFAPDYPGFGLSSMPSTAEFRYTFDNLAKLMKTWIDTLSLTNYVLYLQDYGAPVGFRLATSRPDQVRGLIIQNGNAYLEGLSENLAPLTAYMTNPTSETEQLVRELLKAETTKFQYTHGTQQPDTIAPEAWIYDQYFLDRPGNDAVQLALFRDYRTNPPLYPEWQAYLRTHQPPTLIAWGKNDPFFTEAGARAYVRDVPNASLNLLDTGHFALEDHCEEIASLVRTFFNRQAN